MFSLIEGRDLTKEGEITDTIAEVALLRLTRTFA